MKTSRILLTLAVASVFALSVSLTSAAPESTGNGAPSGAHYNLNIIGVSNPKTADMTGANGHTIFVSLLGKSKINLAPGEFRVLDANGTDGNGAAFQLPNPDPDNDGTTVYSVYARALGKPGGKAYITPCAIQLVTDPITEEVTEEEVCSITTLTVERTKGKQSFENVSKDLLYVYADLDGDGTAERHPLFDEALQDYLWSYDNYGLKHLQLRFYEVPTTI